MSIGIKKLETICVVILATPYLPLVLLLLLVTDAGLSLSQAAALQQNEANHDFA